MDESSINRIRIINCKLLFLLLINGILLYVFADDRFS